MKKTIRTWETVGVEKPELRGIKTYPARTRQQMLKELAAGEEPIDAMVGAGTGEVYTEASEGVRPEHNIRTDRTELALDAIERVRQERASRETEKAEAGQQASGGNRGQSVTE